MPWGRKWHLNQYSCLENPMDRGAWQAIVHGEAKSRSRMKWLSTAHDHWINALLCFVLKHFLNKVAGGSVGGGGTVCLSLVHICSSYPADFALLFINLLHALTLAQSVPTRRDNICALTLFSPYFSSWR